MSYEIHLEKVTINARTHPGFEDISHSNLSDSIFFPINGLWAHERISTVVKQSAFYTRFGLKKMVPGKHINKV